MAEGPTSGPSSWRRWLALTVVIAIVLYARVQTMEPDVARKPPPEPKPPVLREATIYVWGSKKGPYTISWEGVSYATVGRDYILAKNKISSILGDEPKRYHVVFPTSDRRLHSFDVDVWKTQDWEGNLHMALLANDKLVLCDDTTETESQLSHLGDFFVPEDLKDAKPHSVSNFFVA